MSLITSLTIIIISYFWILTISSWLWFWFFLEIRLFFIIAILYALKETNKFKLINYFVVQTLASLLILISALSTNILSSIILIIAILLKLGLFPFSSWVIKIYPTISAHSLIIISLLQKIPPIFIFSALISPNLLLTLWLTITWAPLYRFWAHNWILIYTASSIFYSPIILALIWANQFIGSLFFFTYLSYNILFIIRIYTSNKKLIKIAIIMNLSALPPSVGFIIKLIIAWTLTRPLSFLILIITLIATAPSIYFYINLFIKTLI